MKSYLNFDHNKIGNYSLKYHAEGFFKRIELAFFTILSLIFLIISSISRDFSNKISYFVVDISLPIVNTVIFPINLAIDLTINFQELVSARKENQILKSENAQMRTALITALRIKDENKSLKDLLKFTIPKSTNYQMAEVIGKTHQPFSNQLILKAKKGTNLKNGSAVTTKSTMIGRVIDAINHQARLLLITDAKSHIPVITSSARSRGILYGNNSNLMEIHYLAKNHQIKPGDMVFTSSDGSTLPPGLLVGVVSKVSGKRVFVEPAQDVVDADVVMVLGY